MFARGTLSLSKGWSPEYSKLEPDDESRSPHQTHDFLGVDRDQSACRR